MGGKWCRRLGLHGFVGKPTCEAKEVPRLVSEMSLLGMADGNRVGS